MVPEKDRDQGATTAMLSFLLAYVGGGKKTSKGTKLELRDSSFRSTLCKNTVNEIH